MRHLSAKLVLAVIIGVTLTVVSLNYRQPFADPSMHCSASSPTGWLLEQAWYDEPNYFSEGYPFSARQVPTATGCDATRYLWGGTTGDILFWSLAGFLISLATYPLLARLSCRGVMKRISFLQRS